MAVMQGRCWSRFGPELHSPPRSLRPCDECTMDRWLVLTMPLLVVLAAQSADEPKAPSE